MVAPPCSGNYDQHLTPFNGQCHAMIALVTLKVPLTVQYCLTLVPSFVRSVAIGESMEDRIEIGSAKNCPLRIGQSLKQSRVWFSSIVISIVAREKTLL